MSYDEQQRCVKRARRPNTQSTPLTMSALETAQKEKEQIVRGKDFKASQRQILSRCSADYDQWSRVMVHKKGARSSSDSSDSEGKMNASFLSSKSDCVTAYSHEFEDALETHGVMEADDEQPSNWRQLEGTSIIVGKGPRIGTA